MTKSARKRKRILWILNTIGPLTAQELAYYHSRIAPTETMSSRIAASLICSSKDVGSQSVVLKGIGNNSYECKIYFAKKKIFISRKIERSWKKKIDPGEDLLFPVGE